MRPAQGARRAGSRRWPRGQQRSHGRGAGRSAREQRDPWQNPSGGVRVGTPWLERWRSTVEGERPGPNTGGGGRSAMGVELDELEAEHGAD
jgi:hypothetical protein